MYIYVYYSVDTNKCESLESHSRARARAHICRREEKFSLNSINLNVYRYFRDIATRYYRIIKLRSLLKLRNCVRKY